MTLRRQSAGVRPALDDLLLGQPLGGLERGDAAWQTHFEQTMRRVLASTELSSSVQDGAAQRPASRGTSTLDAPGTYDAIEDVLRTPLPVEAGEPEPSDPYAFEAAESAEYDALRAPLKSGEHAPFRAAAGALETPTAREAAPRATAPLVPLRRTLLWLSMGVGSLAAAAAVALFLRERARPVDLAAQLEVAAPPAQEAPNVSAPVPEAPHAVAALPPTKELTSDALATAATPGGARVATRALSSVRQAQPAAATRAAPAAPAEHEPTMVPAAGPSSLMDHPSTGAISAALSRRLPEAQRCLPPQVPSTAVRLTFRSSGAVAKVDVPNSSLGGDVRACLQQALGAVRVEPFARSSFDVNATISQPKASAPPASP